MKKVAGLIVVLAVLAGGYVYFVRDAVLSLETPGRVYRVDTPKIYLKIEKQTQNHPTPFGDILATIHTAQSAFSLNGLMLAHFSLPEGSAQGRTDEQIIEDGLEGMIQSLKGKKSDTTPIEFRGFPGRECTYHGRYESTVVFGVVRAYIIEQDMVILMTVGTSEAAKTDAEMIGYLNTFTY
jgi:hypothetical protein